MAIVLKKHKIIDSYAALIENGQGGGDKFFDLMQKHLQNANIPNVSFERVQVVAWRLLGGRGRDYLLVEHKSFSKFRMFICARDFGSYLDVTWALTLDPGMFNKQMSKMITGSGYGSTFAALSLFDQQELDAFIVVVHRGVVDTVKSMVEEMNQDFSVVNTRSKSGLAAW